MNETKQFYINVNGGLGFNFALARVITHYGSDFSFFIKSPYWDVFKSCPKVKWVYKDNEGRDFIFDAKKTGAEIVNTRLYDMSDFIYKKLNYTQAWCKLLGLPQIEDSENGTTLKDLELNPIKYFPNTKAQLDEFYQDLQGKGYKDFILVQFWGGQSPLVDVNGQPYSYENEPLKRAYPVNLAQEFVSLYRKAHPETAIVQYSLPNEPFLTGCEKYLYPYLNYYEISKSPKCKGAVTIDSSLAHIITGNCKVITIWGHSLPTSFGYECNINILQNCDRSEILYFTELGASGTKIDYIEPEKLFAEVEDYF